MGGMGTITIGNGLGGVGGGFDAVTPFAYEENHDGMATTTAIDSVGSYCWKRSTCTLLHHLT